MTRRELVWAAAYGAAFADEMRRGCHGQDSTTHTRMTVGDKAWTEMQRTTIDARDEAHRWACTCADAAAERSEKA